MWTNSFDSKLWNCGIHCYMYNPKFEWKTYKFLLKVSRNMGYIFLLHIFKLKGFEFYNFQSILLMSKVTYIKKNMFVLYSDV